MANASMAAITISAIACGFLASFTFGGPPPCANKHSGAMVIIEAINFLYLFFMLVSVYILFIIQWDIA
jgi:hypothetical protein